MCGTSSSSGIFSNDLLGKTEYPDLSTGAASTAAANDQTYTYNALGQKASYTDRTAATHQYGYDVPGRLVSDILPWWAVCSDAKPASHVLATSAVARRSAMARLVAGGSPNRFGWSKFSPRALA